MTMMEALYGKTLAHQLACELENDGFEEPHPEFYLENPTCLSGEFVDGYNKMTLEYLEGHTGNVLISDGFIVGLTYVV